MSEKISNDSVLQQLENATREVLVAAHHLSLSKLLVRAHDVSESAHPYLQSEIEKSSGGGGGSGNVEDHNIDTGAHPEILTTIQDVAGSIVRQALSVVNAHDGDPTAHPELRTATQNTIVQVVTTKLQEAITNTITKLITDTVVKEVTTGDGVKNAILNHNASPEAHSVIQTAITDLATIVSQHAEDINAHPQIKASVNTALQEAIHTILPNAISEAIDNNLAGTIATEVSKEVAKVMTNSVASLVATTVAEQTPTPSSIVPVLSRVATAGVDLAYSRGDHAHPLPTTQLKAITTDTYLVTTADAWTFLRASVNTTVDMSSVSTGVGVPYALFAWAGTITLAGGIFKYWDGYSTMSASTLVLPKGSCVTLIKLDGGAPGSWFVTDVPITSGLDAEFSKCVKLGPHTIWIPSIAFFDIALRQPAVVANAIGGDASWFGMTFSATTVQDACFDFCFPHSWDAGDLSLELLWSTDIAAGTVNWSTYLATQAVGALQDTWASPNTITSEVVPTAKILMRTNMGKLKKLETKAGDIVRLLVRRNATSTAVDTNTGIVILRGAMLTYAVNKGNDA